MLVGALGMEAQIAGGIFAVSLIISGVLNIAYFWPVVYTAFFESEDEHDAKPLAEFPMGGIRDSYESVVAAGGGPAAADGGHEDEGHDTHSDHDDHGHHNGPPPGGWDRRTPFTESTWLMLVPITVIVTGAVVLGVVPGMTGFLDLAIEISEQVLGVTIGGGLA
jgi:multicomponent Na+:H+ antiporter subunit D